jgi:hypothetical protein
MKITEDMVIAYNREIKEALKTIYQELNQGQQKKLLKSEKVKALFERYKIEV